MKNKAFRSYYIASLLSIIAASFYPLYMVVEVAVSMVKNGTVYAEDYPKYIIPYAPISLALIIAVAVMPLLFSRTKKLAFTIGTAISCAVFFIFERILESSVTVTRTFTDYVLDTELEAWQMSLCYVAPSQYTERTWTEVNVLMGEYSPAFKIHFYIISVLLIIAVLNSVYGFAAEILSGERKRHRALVLQSVSAAMFLGMCIWACFTSFYRDGAIHVSALSAVLMAVFFVLMGTTAGLFAASHLLGRKKSVSVLIPSLIASAVSLVMYIGEMCLLSGNLYRFGHGFFFDGIAEIVLAPVDILLIILSGIITAAVSAALMYSIRK